MVINAFEIGIFPLPPTECTSLKTLTSKQMFQILPKAVAQIKAGNTSENLMNEICKIIYSSY